MGAAKSCPVVKTPLPASLDVVDDDAAAAAAPPQGFLVQYLLASRADVALLRPHVPPVLHDDALLAQHEQHPPVPPHPSSGPQAAVAHEGASAVRDADAATRDTSPAHVTIVPRAARRPETSVGSLLHEAGECKPCAWFWRLQGCENGADCRHCHLCDEGAIKARRKARIASQRAKRHEAEERSE